MSVTYFANFMGSPYMDRHEERGIPLDSPYCAGRIDIRDASKEGYDGWDEYSVAPMQAEDWYALGEWLLRLETDEVWPYKRLMREFEKHHGKPINWRSEP